MEISLQDVLKSLNLIWSMSPLGIKTKRYMIELGGLSKKETGLLAPFEFPSPLPWYVIIVLYSLERYLSRSEAFQYLETLQSNPSVWTIQAAYESKTFFRRRK